MCWNYSVVLIDFEQFVAYRRLVWEFSGMLRLSVAHSLTLISTSGFDVVTRKH